MLVSLLLAAAAPNGAWARVNAAADVFFAANTSRVSTSTAGLHRLICQAPLIELEVVIAVGHADASEPDTQALSVSRAEYVKRELVSLGIPAEKIYVEGKGALQPVSKKPAVNRRVELEMTGSGSYPPDGSCELGWSTLYNALSSESARVLSHAWVNSGFMGRRDPAIAAIKIKRMDLLDALMAGPDRIPLDVDDRRQLLKTAIQAGDADVVGRFLHRWIKASEFSNVALPVIWAACEVYGLGPKSSLPIIDVLLAWGATAGGVVSSGYDDSFAATAIECAVRRKDAELVDRLLAARADPNLPLSSPPILSGDGQSAIVKKLLAAGADPMVKSETGAGLFHRLRFQSADDVRWLIDLGLDVNASKKDGETPLEIAVAYASPEVLDAFLAAGAKLDLGRRSLVSAALRHVPGLVWLLQHGARLEDPSGVATSTAWKDTEALDVLNALHDRNVNLSLSDIKGRTPMGAAIEAWSPALVERLVELGAVAQPAQLQTARVAVRNLQIQQHPSYGCVDCYMAPGAYQAATARLNTPDLLADRQQRKDRMMAILDEVPLLKTQP